MRGIVFLIIFFCLLITSCREKVDTDPPVILITSPVENTTFSSDDIINIKGEIRDDSQVKSVSISLIDQDMNVIIPPVSISSNSAKVLLDKDFYINGQVEETGSCFLKISASDGINVSNEYIMVTIMGIIRELESVYLFSGNGSTNVYILDSSSQPAYEFSLTHTFLDAAVSSENRQIYILSTDGLLKAINLPMNSSAWEKTNLNDFSANYKGSLDIFENLLFATYRSGYIYGFDETGTIRQSVTLSDQQYFPVSFNLHGDYLFSLLETDYPLPNLIGKYYYSTGYAMDHVEVDFDPEMVYPCDEDHVIIFGNKNNILKVCTLSVTNNLLYEISGFPAEQLWCSEYLDTDRILLGLGNNVCSYDLYGHYISTVIYGIKADIIRYESLHGL
ncbi:MAG: hypothetical protein ABIJ16_12960, partial [Bacteroidota bacterium]